MKTIILPRQKVINAAKSRGISACEEINRLLSASLGYRVCSHLLKTEPSRLTFSFVRECVPIRSATPSPSMH